MKTNQDLLCLLPTLPDEECFPFIFVTEKDEMSLVESLVLDFTFLLEPPNPYF